MDHSAGVQRPVMPLGDLLPTMASLIRAATDAYGDRVLLRTGTDELRYTEADRRSAAVAAGLLARGVRKGEHIGILMPNSADWIVAYFAVTRIGAVAVPINTFVRPRELGWTLRHADVSTLLCHPRFLSNDYLATLEAAIPGLEPASGQQPLRLSAAPLLRSIFVWGDHDRGWTASVGNGLAGLIALGASAEAAGIDDAFIAEVESCVSPADPAIIVYTSGSTAEPKGIIHSNGTVVRHSLNVTESYVTTGDDIMFTSMPFFWIGGLICGLLAVVHHGATIVTQPAFDPGEALELMERHRATIALGWPQQGNSLVEHPSHPSRDLSSIRRTSLPAFVSPDVGPPAISSDALGMTETCSTHTNFDPYVALDEARRGTHGRSVPGHEHKIIDPDTGETLAPGVVGEICVRGSSMMIGRHKVERHEVFDADGWYHTGDAGYLDADGWMFFAGRLGDMIKTSGGTNVAPAEVEAVLNDLPEVLEAHVTGVGDGAGVGTQLVAAAAVLRTGQQLDEDQLRAAAKAELAAFKVPAIVWICTKDELPFTDSGKVRKADLAELLRQHRHRFEH
jgi:acyl-CoA synthetase (AMP-forming)/AMP-acid ligase II